MSASQVESRLNSVRMLRSRTIRLYLCLKLVYVNGLRNEVTGSQRYEVGVVVLGLEPSNGDYIGINEISRQCA